VKQNEQLTDILDMVVSRQLGKAVSSLENWLLAYPRQQDMDELIDIRDAYRLMAGYWQRGFDDPQRPQVYDQLLRRVYVLTADVSIRHQLSDSTYMKVLHQRPRKAHNDWSLSAIRASLESFVSELALLELQPEAERRRKSNDLYTRHNEQMRDLFDYILTSRQWRPRQADAFLDMLLSPTLASIDQQLIVSAITLSATQNFCYQKFRILSEVWLQATDEPLRQRALVGWVLAAASDSRAWHLYTEVYDTVSRLCSDEATRQELAELQMQLVYCQQADQDHATIQKEILPDIMSGSRIKFTGKGLVEMDEDSLDDILHPEASEMAMERMEQSIQRMVDMQKQGADIYFGGFSQMKRFPFFSDISNWFVPFYPQHPAISQTWQNVRGGKFLRAITRAGAFCDSDKYSFVLAFTQVLDRLPANLLQMIEKGEASAEALGGEMAQEAQQAPAFIRRVYLQNLYRFFRIFHARSEFTTPFGQEGSYLFFTHPLFAQASLSSQAVATARFLMKRQRYADAASVLANIPSEQRDLQFFLLAGAAMQHTASDALPAPDYCFREALKLQPDNQRALAGLARALFASQHYDEALARYEQLLLQQPDHRTYQLNAAVCLLNLQRTDEALKLLYKLSYVYPDDLTVSRIMAWAQTVGGKYEQAEKRYSQLLAAEKPEPADLLNYGYCLWLERRIADAIGMFRRFLDCQQQSDFSIVHEFTATEHQLLADHGISDIEIQLMLDACAPAGLNDK
jgi:tetratricopeptide (TPR) repeat protein